MKKNPITLNKKTKATQNTLHTISIISLAEGCPRTCPSATSCLSRLCSSRMFRLSWQDTPDSADERREALWTQYIDLFMPLHTRETAGICAWRADARYFFCAPLCLWLLKSARQRVMTTFIIARREPTPALLLRWTQFISLLRSVRRDTLYIFFGRSFFGDASLVVKIILRVSLVGDN